MYSVLTENVCRKIKGMATSKYVDSDYALVVFSFNSVVWQFTKENIPKKEIKDAMKAIVYMRAYLFAMPHMSYPEDLRYSFFKSCWELSSYMEEKARTKTFHFEPEVDFLLRAVSDKVLAMLSIWDKKELFHGICG